MRSPIRGPQRDNNWLNLPILTLTRMRALIYDFIAAFGAPLDGRFRSLCFTPRLLINSTRLFIFRCCQPASQPRAWAQLTAWWIRSLWRHRGWHLIDSKIADCLERQKHRWWPFRDWRPWHHRHVSFLLLRRDSASSHSFSWLHFAPPINKHHISTLRLASSARCRSCLLIK